LDWSRRSRSSRRGTRTAQDAARAIGTTLGQIVKSLVFVADGRPLLVLAAGTPTTVFPIPPDALARVTGGQVVDLASPQ
jgi:prolyl-tRNA editing enzyme YbaK/EbsC (Cys-tRNA(Pro) deacylase)